MSVINYGAAKAWIDKVLTAVGITTSLPGRVFNVPLSGGALSGIGTDAAAAAGTVYYSQIFLPANKTLTGVAVLNGTTVGTDKLIGALYSADGELLASSALAGTTGSGADTFQELDFTATYDAVGPRTYFVALQLNGTTHQNQRMAAATPLGWTGSVAGTFGTLPSITPPTTFTADKGPIAYLY